MGYREDWFNAHPSPTGMYQCRRCHGWFKKEDIDIDHIIPQHYGGMDMQFNLQPMCKHCNRSKQADISDTPKDLLVNGVHNVVGGAINSALGINTKPTKKRTSKKKNNDLGNLINGIGKLF